MKKSFKLKAISLLLTLALLTCGMPVIALDTAAPATAAPATTPTALTAPAAEEAAADLLGPGEMTAAELATAVLPAADIPDALPAGNVAEKQHVNRLYEQEEGASHILFQNRDGGKTAYFFGRPVKYMAEDGSLRDKSKTLIPVNRMVGTLGYDYGVEDNSLRQYYALNPQIGLRVEIGETAIRVQPHAVSSPILPRGQIVDNTVVYQNIFGQNTALVYTPLLSGVKEDILLRTYTGRTDFTFTYRTTGLTLLDVDGTYTFVDADGNPVATLGEILITDAEGKSAFGSVTVTPGVGQTYTVTVHADQAFLTAETTTYPVTIDPTIYEIYQNQDVTIEDYGVFNASLHPSLDYTTHFLGYWTTSCIGRIVYRFPIFIPNATSLDYDSMNPAQIGSVSLNVYASGNLDTTVTARAMTTGPQNGYTNAAEKFIDSSLFYSCASGGLPSTASMAGPGSTYSIDMTEIVKAWLSYNQGINGNYSPSNGMSLINNNEHDMDSTGTSSGYPYFRYVKSVEDPASELYLQIDTSNYGGDFYIVGKTTGHFLNVQNNNQPAFTSIYDHVNNSTTKWHIEYLGNGTYNISRGTADYFTIFNPLYCPTTNTGDATYIDYQWEIASGTNGAVRLRNVGYDVYLADNTNDTPSLKTTGTVSDNTVQWWLIKDSEYHHMTSFHLPADPWLSQNSTYTFPILNVTPSNATWQTASFFEWESSNVNFPITSAGTLTIPASGGITTVTVTHRASGITESVQVNSGAVESGRYKLRSEESKKYMDIDSALTAPGSYLNHYDFHGGRQQEWLVTLQPNGGYTILSDEHSNLYVDVNSIGNGVNVIQNTDAEKTVWQIEETVAGNYRIYVNSASGTAYAISTPSSIISDDLILTQYASDTDYHDEWDFIDYSHVNYVELEGQQMSNWCWVACARMFAKNYCDNITQTQENAVVNIKGSSINDGGTVIEAAQAIAYYANNSFPYQLINVAEYVYSEYRVKTFIQDGHVLYITRKNLYDTNNHHASVITGYVQIDGHTLFIIQDPWPVHTGNTYLCSYDYITCGWNSASYDTREEDAYFWWETLAVHTTYAEDRILPDLSTPPS